MKNVFKNILKEKFNVIFFLLLTFNILAICGFSIFIVKTNNNIKNIKIEQEQKEVKEKEEKLSEGEDKGENKNNEEKENVKKEEIKNDKKFKFGKKLFDDFVFLNENCIKEYYNKKLEKKENIENLEYIAKSFYRLFNYDNLREFVEDFKNFEQDIGGLFLPNYRNISEEELDKPFSMKNKVKIIISPNGNGVYKIIIFRGSGPFQGMYMLHYCYVNDNGKLDINGQFDVADIEELDVK